MDMPVNKVYSSNPAQKSVQQASGPNPYLRFICSRAYMTSLGYAVVVAIDIALLAFGLQYGQDAEAAAIAGVGLISFFSVIGLVNGATGDGSLNNGEIRKAITAAFITVYLTVVSLSIVKHDPFPLQNDFTMLVGSIVMFYFGSSTYRDYLSNKTAQSTANTVITPINNTPPAPDTDPDDGGDSQKGQTTLSQNIQIISPNPAVAAGSVTTGELSTTDGNLTGAAS
jgi:hypothetical protein